MDAAEYFECGLYKVYTHIIKVGPEGELTIGVTKDKQVDTDWAVFDNFRLTYFGKQVSQGTITGIDAIKNNVVEDDKMAASHSSVRPVMVTDLPSSPSICAAK